VTYDPRTFWEDRLSEHFDLRGTGETGLSLAYNRACYTLRREVLDRALAAARFVLADVGETPIEGTYDLVNAFDVLYHITDDARWGRALRHLGTAVQPGGLLLVTDTFETAERPAAHNRMRPLAAYAAVLEPLGFQLGRPRPDHVLLNRELGAFRFLNRAPVLLLAIDRVLLRLGSAGSASTNKLLVARRMPR